MSIKVGIAILVILATMTMAITSISIPASADKSSGSNGLEKADQNVHSNTPGGFGGQQDLNFHVGTCNGGHTTAALNSIGGCAILPSPPQCHAQHVGPCASLP
jgi:hypothetical protein